VRPTLLNPLDMPGPEQAAEIRDALATLIRHGMIARNIEDEPVPDE
jgi:hypothetical protein